MAFTTIYIAPGVSEREYQRAARVRGRGAACRKTTEELMEAADFALVRERDATREFLRSTRAYIAATHVHEGALREEWGEDTFRKTAIERRGTLELIEAGVLRRGMYVARPSTGTR